LEKSRREKREEFGKINGIYKTSTEFCLKDTRPKNQSRVKTLLGEFINKCRINV
jgi:hypothetical protein